MYVCHYPFALKILLKGCNKRSEIIGKNVAAYVAERLVLQETFLKLKIRGLYKRELLIMAAYGIY